ncbi:hypothetical protein DEH69_20400 [Streptomyces sp. PT12]|nr:hypothetical protein DEH69_20400 [Streptomyces sp. PT12]
MYRGLEENRSTGGPRRAIIASVIRYALPAAPAASAAAPRAALTFLHADAAGLADLAGVAEPHGFSFVAADGARR